MLWKYSFEILVKIIYNEIIKVQRVAYGINPAAKGYALF